MENMEQLLSFAKDITISKETYIRMINLIGENHQMLQFLIDKNLWEEYNELTDLQI